MTKRGTTQPEPGENVLIASDHAGFRLKEALQEALPDVHWEDMGPQDDSRVDYPDFAEKLARRVAAGDARWGVLICGSGIGMSMAANKVQGVRAAVVENPVAARLSREHNDSNVLCLGARFVAPEYAAEIFKAWFGTPFDPATRHGDRVKKINLIKP